jgi:hypothetical protein
MIRMAVLKHVAGGNLGSFYGDHQVQAGASGFDEDLGPVQKICARGFRSTRVCRVVSGLLAVRSQRVFNWYVVFFAVALFY